MCFGGALEIQLNSKMTLKLLKLRVRKLDASPIPIWEGARPHFGTEIDASDPD